MNQSNQNESMRAMLEQVHDVLSHYCIDMPDSKKYNDLGRLTADIRELFNDIDEEDGKLPMSKEELVYMVTGAGTAQTARAFEARKLAWQKSGT